MRNAVVVQDLTANFASSTRAARACSASRSPAINKNKPATRNTMKTSSPKNRNAALGICPIDHRVDSASRCYRLPFRSPVPWHAGAKRAGAPKSEIVAPTPTPASTFTNEPSVIANLNPSPRPRLNRLQHLRRSSSRANRKNAEELARSAGKILLLSCPENGQYIQSSAAHRYPNFSAVDTFSV